MKNLWFVAFTLIAVLNEVQCSTNEKVQRKKNFFEQTLESRREYFGSYLKEMEAKCPGVIGKLEQATKTAQECDDKIDDSVTICAAIQIHTLNCTRPLLQVVDDCLPTKAKGLPLLAAKSLVSLIDYLCKQNGETILELLNPCLWKEVKEGDDKFDDCKKRAKSEVDKYSNNTPTPDEVCSSIGSFRDCAQSHLSFYCQNEKTRSAWLGVYDSMVAPCEKTVKF